MLIKVLVTACFLSYNIILKYIHKEDNQELIHQLKWVFFVGVNWGFYLGFFILILYLRFGFSCSQRNSIMRDCNAISQLRTQCIFITFCNSYCNFVKMIIIDVIDRSGTQRTLWLGQHVMRPHLNLQSDLIKEEHGKDDPFARSSEDEIYYVWILVSQRLLFPIMELSLIATNS